MGAEGAGVGVGRGGAAAQHSQHDDNATLVTATHACTRTQADPAQSTWITPSAHVLAGDSYLGIDAEGSEAAQTAGREAGACLSPGGRRLADVARCAALCGRVSAGAPALARVGINPAGGRMACVMRSRFLSSSMLCAWAGLAAAVWGRAAAAARADVAGPSGGPAPGNSGPEDQALWLCWAQPCARAGLAAVESSRSGSSGDSWLEGTAPGARPASTATRVGGRPPWMMAEADSGGDLSPAFLLRDVKPRAAAAGVVCCRGATSAPPPPGPRPPDPHQPDQRVPCAIANASVGPEKWHGRACSRKPPRPGSSGMPCTEPRPPQRHTLHAAPPRTHLSSVGGVVGALLAAATCAVTGLHGA